MARLPPIVWQKAEWLVVEKGRTLEEVAEITGISLSALKRASAKRQWMERRRGNIAFSDKIRLAAGRMADQLLSDPDAKPDGLLKVTKSYLEIKAMPEAEEAERLDRVWKAICDAVAAEGDDDLKRGWDHRGGRVKAAVERTLLGAPAEGQPAGRKPKGAPLSPDTVDRIRDKVLGVAT